MAGLVQSYSMFIASTVPVIGAQWFEVYAAARLLVSKQRKRWTPRVALCLLVASAAVAIYTDTQQFNSNAAFDSELRVRRHLV